MNNDEARLAVASELHHESVDNWGYAQSAQSKYMAAFFSTGICALASVATYFAAAAKIVAVPLVASTVPLWVIPAVLAAVSLAAGIYFKRQHNAYDRASTTGHERWEKLTGFKPGS